MAALFGCLEAGVIAVPCFPPTGRRAAERFSAIIADCEPDTIIVSSWLAAQAETLAGKLPPAARQARWLFLDEAFSGGAVPPGPGPAPADPAGADSQSPVLLQYTSGSTGDPKGIMLSQHNLISNCLALQDSMGAAVDRIGCSWLPPYHDMGLMGTIMLALHGGWPLVMLSPAHFVQQPYRWLKAVTDYRVTISVAPNFALDMCVDTITDAELRTLDLSALRQLYCGAEPVLSGTLARFRDRFEACGYQESALVPCYGMAEATLFVSGKPRATLPRSLRVDKGALERGKVEPASPQADATEIMSCGTVARANRVVIVDPQTGQPTGPSRTGEIWVSGPNVAQGYFQRPELSAETFTARLSGDAAGAAYPGWTYLRTGDVGFVAEGELYVTGRIKDVVIIAGRNLYPHDIEASVVAAHPDLRRAAAFSVAAEQHEEELVVVAEFRRAGRRTADCLARAREAVIRAVAADHAVRLGALHLGPPGTVATTTSGKVRRAATRQAYLAGALKSLAPAASQGGARPASGVASAGSSQ